MSSSVRLIDFESFHAARITLSPAKPSLRELVITLLVTLAIAPFSFVTFFVIPMMGQITVGLSLFLTLLYLYFRRSVLVAGTAIIGAVFFWGLLFVTIQGIKQNLEVPLFFFTATGIPVCTAYCIFIGTRIWTIRGGVDPA
jgi:hypothetical protein